MAKERNTVAKRQRETDKRRKAEEKRERRATRKLDDRAESQSFETGLTTAENSVLKVFRDYLMTPGKMLCFNSADLQSFRMPLVQLIDKGMLQSERFHGGYSLTETGFAAMKDRQ